MRLLVQRVKEASVRVEGEVIGKIGRGVLVFFGVHKDDSPASTAWLAKKLAGLRLFPDSEDKMNLSLQDVDGGVLVVSQFTLYASCRNGRRPDFTDAARGPEARDLYHQFLQELEAALQHPVETGRFAASMEVSLVNDGPVTFIVDSKNET